MGLFLCACTKDKPCEGSVKRQAWEPLQTGGWVRCPWGKSFGAETWVPERSDSKLVVSLSSKYNRAIS